MAQNQRQPRHEVLVTALARGESHTAAAKMAGIACLETAADVVQVCEGGNVRSMPRSEFSDFHGANSFLRIVGGDGLRPL